MGFCWSEYERMHFFWSEFEFVIEYKFGLNITLTHIQQLLFLDPTIFTIEWSRDSPFGSKLDLMFTYQGGNIAAKVQGTQVNIIEFLIK